MDKKTLVENFDPNGIGVENGNFIGLPFDLDTADLVLLPVPWDVTVSYGGGTSRGPRNILAASPQLDLYLPHAPDLWKRGIYFIPPDEDILKKNDSLRPKALRHIEYQEGKKIPNEENNLQDDLKEINLACAELEEWVYQQSKALLGMGKRVGLVGGEHSVPLGYLRALAERHSEFGILQVDAHCDLRAAYEGFEFSHASIFHNALARLPQIKRLSQVGIRDYCEEEAMRVAEDDRIRFHSDGEIKAALFEGRAFSRIVDDILAPLPQKVYVSFDIDGLSPDLCPGTGTPVPGGFSFAEAVYLLQRLKVSGREIIGFDLCEVGGKDEWDGNVGARILYQLLALFN